MDLSLFEEVLGFTGIGFAVFGSVLLLFWKADDALSKALKEDISLHLMCLDPERIKVKSMIAISKLNDQTFGKKLWSIRAFVTSTVLSIMFLVTFNLLALVQNKMNGDFLYYYEQAWVEYFIFSVIINVVFDFISVNQTRFFLRKSISSGAKTIFFFLDFIATAATIVLAFIFAVFFFFSLIIFMLGKWPGLSGALLLIDLITDFFLDREVYDERKFLFLNVDKSKLFIYCAIFTTFMTSIWIWLYFIGIAFIRISNKSRPFVNAVRYALPIASKPMRSIGLVIAPIAGLGTWLSTLI